MTEISVCIGSSCHLKGSYNVIQTLQQLIEAEGLHDQIEMKAQFCMRQCQSGVSVSVDGKTHSVAPETVRDFFRLEVLPKLKA